MDRRVLIVDDDPAMLKLLGRYLTSAGYDVLAAADGEEAIRILHRVGPPIVLSDWSMPGMDGLQLCQTIRSSEAIGFVYIIILTAHSEKECVVQALDAGANDFLSKPFHRQELIARLSAGMRIISLEADLMRQQRELYKANAELAVLNRKLEQMATTDELTGLANRREAMNQFRNYWSTSSRHNQPLSCVMMDIDLFKRCNDDHGHEAGDLVLRKVADLFRRGSRASDLVCRVGGEEFLVLCPNTDGPSALQLAERFRAAVEAAPIPFGSGTLQVTISGGVADRGSETQGFEEILRRADQALYHAKHSGRNRVTLAGEEDAAPPASLAVSGAGS